jgi:ankyrin repeat protein
VLLFDETHSGMLKLSEHDLFTPLRVALAARSYHCANWLVSNGAHVDNLTILLSVFIGDIGLLHRIKPALFRRKLHVRFAHRYFLEYAIEWNKTSVIKELLSGQDIVRTYDNGRWTPLGLLLEHCSADTIHYFLRDHPRLAQVDFIHQYKRTTPLHIAVKEFRLEVIALLLQYGARVNAEDGHKRTVLHVATKLMRTFQDEHSKEGQWMLECFGVVFKLLLQSGADPNAKDRFQKTPFHYLFERISSFALMPCVQLFLLHGTDVHALSVEGTSALHLASKFGHASCVELLVLLGADVNGQDVAGNTPLHMACAVEARDVVRVLVKYGARVDIENDRGYSSRNVCDDEYIKELFDTVKRVPLSLKSLSLRRLRLSDLETQLCRRCIL